jgi:thiol:disulfide interchange protein DsbD
VSVRLLTAVAVVVSLLATLAFAQPALDGNRLASVSLVADTSAVAGKPFTLGVRVKIEPKWHIYWANPGEAGEATRVDFTLPPGFTVGPLQYPTPRRIESEGPVISHGYEDEVLLLATVTPPATLKTGTLVAFAAHVAWMACDKTCLPGEGQASLTLPVAASADAANAALFEAWRAQLPASRHDVADVKMSGTVRPDGGQLVLSVDWKGQKPNNVAFFLPPIDNAAAAEPVPTGDGAKQSVTFDIRPFSGQKLPAGRYDIVIGYDDANGHRRGLAVPFEVR